MEAVEYTSRWGSFSGIQDGLAPYTAEVNADDLSVTVGTTRRIYDFMGVAAAGFLVDKAKKVEFKLEICILFKCNVRKIYGNL